LRFGSGRLRGFLGDQPPGKEKYRSDQQDSTATAIHVHGINLSERLKFLTARG
jgi:hypothetical protein